MPIQSQYGALIIRLIRVIRRQSIRNIAGQTVTLEKGDLAERGHRPQSIMPEGLLAPFTTAELANLLAWLESLKKTGE